MTYTPTGLRDKPGPADDREHPRLVEEHHVVGPHGEDELEATDGRSRRWYHVRAKSILVV